MVPKISVIMPVYNTGKYLKRTVESILNQTFTEFELLVIDDLSKDNSLNIVETYAKNDKRIKIIPNKKHLGPCLTRNKLLKKAKGKYIAICDSDDVNELDRLKIEYEYLEANPKIFMVGGNASFLRGKSETKVFEVQTDEDSLREDLSEQNCMHHPTVMFRNAGFTYREKTIYAEDYDLFLIALSKGKRIVNLPDYLLKYRLSEAGVSFRKSWKQKLMAEKVKEFYHQRLESGKDDYDSFNPQDILGIDIDNTTNKTVLSTEIEANFRINNFIKAKSFMKRYFKHHGIFNKYVLYYFLTFIGKDNMNRLRKVFRG